MGGYSKERQSEYYREWRKTNMDKIRRAQKSWGLRHPAHVKWDKLKTNAAKNGMPFALTREEFVRWFIGQKQACSYCGLLDLSFDVPLPNNVLLKNFSIDRKDSDLPYTIENMVLACWFCNRGKGNVFTHDEWKEIAEKYVRPKWMAKLEKINANN